MVFILRYERPTYRNKIWFSLQNKSQHHHISDPLSTCYERGITGQATKYSNIAVSETSAHLILRNEVTDQTPKGAKPCAKAARRMTPKIDPLHKSSWGIQLHKNSLALVFPSIICPSIHVKILKEAISTRRLKSTDNSVIPEETQYDRSERILLDPTAKT